MTVALKELEELSVVEKIQIVEKLWDSIAKTNTEIPMPTWQKDELDRRKQCFLESSDTTTYTWEEIKKNVKKQHKA